jgi:geranylgeranyl diphosphate synthase type II
MKQPTSLFVYLEERRALVEKALARSIPAATVPPETLHQAMRYSLLGGGKRLRPIMVLCAAEAVAGPSKSVILNAMHAACAVEMLHACSLIHDDLPCMDDDDIRHRQPAAHRVFGEAVALLAGDALLTRAFGQLTSVTCPKRYPLSMLLVEMSDSVGSRRLIGGQVADLEAEGKPASIAQVRFIHERKTAEMVTLSLRLGAMTANATPLQLRRLTEFGTALGLAYQIIDDILDVTQSSETLGKSAGKDLRARKATYPAAIGLDAAKREAARLTCRAQRALDALGPKAFRLAQLSNRLLARTS